MSTHNNGVSLKFIGFFVFLVLTMNCLSLVSGAAMDNKEAAVVCSTTCSYNFTVPTYGTESDDNLACTPDNSNSYCVCYDVILTPYGPVEVEYHGECPTANGDCIIYAYTDFMGMGLMTIPGKCNQDTGKWCCSASGSGMNGKMCNCA